MGTVRSILVAAGVLAALSGCGGSTSEAPPAGPGPAASLVFVAPPVGGSADAALGDVSVEARDAQGRPVALPAEVTLSIASGPAGAAPITALGSWAPGLLRATFADVALRRSGSYVLRATSGTLHADSTSFQIAHGAAAKLLFSIPPASATAGALLSPQVRLEDAWGNLVTTGSVEVTVALQGGGALAGTSTASTVDGVATFADLSIEAAGAGYALVASAAALPDLSPEPSPPFAIAPAAPDAARSGATAAAASAVAGATVALEATVLDEYGNAVPGEAVTFTATGTANELVQPAGTTDAAGLAAGSLRSTKAEAKTVTAWIAGGTVALSGTAGVTFVPGAASAAASTLAAAPATATAGGAPVVLTATVRDAWANPVSGAAVALSRAGAGTLVAPASVTDPAGVTTGAISSAAAGVATVTATVDAAAVATTTVTFEAALPAGACAAGKLRLPPATPVHDVEFGFSDLAVADLTGDGYPDVVMPNVGAVAILPGRGDGSFGAVRTFSLGSGVATQAVAVADLDRDGRLDVATANSQPDGFSVLAGQPGGTLGSATTYAAPSFVWDLLAADLDGDAAPELVGAALHAGRVLVLRNRGDGSFDPVVAHSTGAALGGGNASPLAIAAGDLDGDGHLDVVTANTRSSVSVLLNAGDGSFRDATELAAPVSVLEHVGLALGDVDGGALDIVVAAGEVLAVLPGLGDGTFGAPVVSAPGSYGFGGLALADVNGDGWLDAALGTFTDRFSVVMLGRGDGTFGEPTRWAAPANMRALALADLTGDAEPDLVSGASWGAVYVLPGNGDGTFRGRRPAPIRFGLVGGGTVADLNRDGHADLVTAEIGSGPGPGTNAVAVLGRGDGTFGAARVSPVLPSGAGEAHAVGDVDGDGDLDLVVLDGAYGAASAVALARGNGDGTFGAAAPLDVFGDWPSAVALSDLTGDARLDLVVAFRGTSQLAVLRGDGAGSFTAAALLGTEQGPEALAVVDVNADGRRDLAVVNRLSASVGIFLGNGDGTFQGATPVHVDLDPVAIATGDVNGDGRTDLAVAHWSPGTTTVHLGRGDGTFDPAGVRSFSTGHGTHSVALGDLDGDGDHDLVTASMEEASANVLLGDGAGGFLPRVAYSGGFSAGTVRLADADEDGHLDVLAMSGHGLQVLLGAGDGSLRAPAFLAGPARIEGALAADVTGDGVPDLLGAGATPSSALLAFVGRGDGTFAPVAITTLAAPAGAALAAGDLDGDGVGDALVAGGTFTVPLLSRGDGTFAPQPAVATGAPGAFALARLDGDAHLDLVVANGIQNTVSVLRGKGDGTFHPRATYPAGGDAAHVSLADLDGDEALDLLVASRIPSPNAVAVLRGNGDATFQAPRTMQVPMVDAVAAADLDLDGRLDIVATSLGVTTVLFAKADGTYEPPWWSQGRGSESVAIADVDGDGHPDAVTRAAVLLARPGGPERLGFEVPTSASMGPTPDIGLTAAMVADLDGDGRADVVGRALEGLLPLVSTCAP